VLVSLLVGGCVDRVQDGAAASATSGEASSHPYCEVVCARAAQEAAVGRAHDGMQCRLGSNGRHYCGYDCQPDPRGRWSCSSVPSGQCVATTSGDRNCR